MFAAAVQKLPEGTLTRDEIRAIIDAEYLTIPVTGAGVTQSDARPGVGAENDEQPQASRPEGSRSAGASAAADSALAIEAAALLAECRGFLHQVIDLTSEQQFQIAIDEARATASSIQPEKWILQLLELARRFHQELMTVGEYEQ
jgi:hypothetical protein